jgi:hypothetical protein
MDANLSTQLANNGIQILKRGKKSCSTNHGEKKTLSPNGINNFNKDLLRNSCNLNPKKIVENKIK